MKSVVVQIETEFVWLVIHCSWKLRLSKKLIVGFLLSVVCDYLFFNLIGDLLIVNFFLRVKEQKIVTRMTKGKP
jgi:multisubunit Na+/H+ antiporter MnhE subunit